MEKKAVLFFDIDYTLTDGDLHFVPESATKAIRAAQKNGHLCFVNTGRPYTHIDAPVKEIGLDGFICSCGVEILRREPDGSLRTVMEAFPPVETQHYIRDLAHRLNVSCIFEGEGGVWHDGTIPCRDVWLLEHERMTAMGVHASDNVYEPGFFFAKFLVDDLDTPEHIAFEKEVDRFFVRVDRGGFFECVPKGCDKGKALDEVMRLYGSGRTSIVFGDSANDFTMFEHADIAVAMGNAIDSVKAMADYVTDDLHEDGIANAIRHFGLA